MKTSLCKFREGMKLKSGKVLCNVPQSSRFLTTLIFPDSQLNVLSYNRCVRHLAAGSKTWTSDSLLQELALSFEVTPSAAPVDKRITTASKECRQDLSSSTTGADSFANVLAAASSSSRSCSSDNDDSLSCSSCSHKSDGARSDCSLDHESCSVFCGMSLSEKEEEEEEESRSLPVGTPPAGPSSSTKDNDRGSNPSLSLCSFGQSGVASVGRGSAEGAGNAGEGGLCMYLDKRWYRLTLRADASNASTGTVKPKSSKEETASAPPLCDIDTQVRVVNLKFLSDYFNKF
jgi:hypothetical protein